MQAEDYKVDHGYMIKIPNSNAGRLNEIKPIDSKVSRYRRMIRY